MAARAAFPRTAIRTGDVPMTGSVRSAARHRPAPRSTRPRRLSCGSHARGRARHLARRSARYCPARAGSHAQARAPPWFPDRTKLRRFGLRRFRRLFVCIAPRAALAKAFQDVPSSCPLRREYRCTLVAQIAGARTAHAQGNQLAAVQGSEKELPAVTVEAPNQAAKRANEEAGATRCCSSTPARENRPSRRDSRRPPCRPISMAAASTRPWHTADKQRYQLPQVRASPRRRSSRRSTSIDTEDAVKYMPSLFVRKRNDGDNQPVLATRTWGLNSSARTLVYADDHPDLGADRQQQHHRRAALGAGRAGGDQARRFPRTARSRRPIPATRSAACC